MWHSAQALAAELAAPLAHTDGSGLPRDWASAQTRAAALRTIAHARLPEVRQGVLMARLDEIVAWYADWLPRECAYRAAHPRDELEGVARAPDADPRVRCAPPPW